MTEDEWEDLHRDDQTTKQGVDAGSPAVAGIDQDQDLEFDNDFVENNVSDMTVDDNNGLNDGDNIGQEELAKGSTPEEVDDKGVSYKNRYMELKRKLESQKNKDIIGQQLPPVVASLPPVQPFTQSYQPAQSVQQSPPTPSLEEQAVEIESKLAQTQDRTESVRLLRQLNQIDSSIVLRNKFEEQETEKFRMDMGTRIAMEYPDALNPATPLGQRANAYLAHVYRSNLDYAELATQRAARDLGIQPKTDNPPTQQQRTVLPRSRPQTPVKIDTSSQQKSSLTKLTPFQEKIARAWNLDSKKVSKRLQEGNY